MYRGKDRVEKFGGDEEVICILSRATYNKAY